MKMEHPHNLLKLVVKQHFNHRPQILESADNVLQEYSGGKITYEQTLSTIFQLFKDLPSDIVLYYLSTVPLPENQEIKSTSILPGLMKQMLIPSYHNTMRPVLLKYLNEKVPPLVPLSNTVPNENEISITDAAQGSNSQSSEDISENKENLTSVIDENIKQDKIRNKKAAKARARNIAVKSSNIKPLSLLCANNIYKNHHSYFSRYKKQKREAWRLVNSEKCNKEELDTCYNVIRDVNKKIKWLGAIKTGQITKDIIEEEYGQSDVFYLERHLQDTVSEDVLDLSTEVTSSIDVFMNKC